MGPLDSAWLLAVVLVGCSAPTQYGGPIHVDHHGVPARLGHLCRIGPSSAAPAEACSTLPTATAAPSPTVRAGPVVVATAGRDAPKEQSADAPEAPASQLLADQPGLEVQQILYYWR
jgi:hypothetical protein